MNFLGRAIFSKERELQTARGPFDCIELLRSARVAHQLSALDYVETYIKMNARPSSSGGGGGATAARAFVPMPPGEVTKSIADLGMTSENYAVRIRSFAIMTYLYRCKGRSSAIGLHLNEVRQAITTELSAYENIQSTNEALELLHEFSDNDICSFCSSTEGQSVIKAACSNSNNNSSIRAAMIRGLGRVLVKVWCLLLLGEDSKVTNNGTPYGVTVACLPSYLSADDATKAKEDFKDFVVDWIGGLCVEAAGTGPKVTLEGMAIAEPTPLELEAIYSVVASVYDIYWPAFDVAGAYCSGLRGLRDHNSKSSALLRACSVYMQPLVETINKSLFDDPYMLYSRWRYLNNSRDLGGFDDRAAIERVGSAMCKVALLDTCCSASNDYDFGARAQVFSFDKVVDESKASRYNGNKGLGRNKVAVEEFCGSWLQSCLLPSLSSCVSVDACSGALVDAVDILMFRAMYDLRSTLSEELLFHGMRTLNKLRVKSRDGEGDSYDGLYTAVIARLFIVLRMTPHVSRPQYLLFMVPHLQALLEIHPAPSATGYKMVAEFATLLFVPSEGTLITGPNYIRKIVNSILGRKLNDADSESASSGFNLLFVTSICCLLRALIRSSQSRYNESSSSHSSAVVAAQLSCACAVINSLHAYLRAHCTASASSALLSMVVTCGSVCALLATKNEIFTAVHSVFVCEATLLVNNCLHDNGASAALRIDTLTALVDTFPLMSADPSNSASSAEKYVFCAFNLLRAEITSEITVDGAKAAAAPLGTRAPSRQLFLVSMGCRYVDSVMALMVTSRQDFLYSACVEFIDSIHTTVNSRLLLDSKEVLVAMRRRLLKYAGQWSRDDDAAAYSHSHWLYSGSTNGSDTVASAFCAADTIALVDDVVTASVAFLMPSDSNSTAADEVKTDDCTAADNDYLWHELSGSSDIIGLFACEVVSAADRIATVFVRVYNNTTIRLPPFSLQFALYSKSNISGARNAHLFPDRQYTVTVDEYTSPSKYIQKDFQFLLGGLCSPTYSITTKFSGMERDASKQFSLPPTAAAVAAATDVGKAYESMSVAISSTAKMVPVTSQLRCYLGGACSSAASFASLTVFPPPTTPHCSPGIPIAVFIAQRERLGLLITAACVCQDADVGRAVKNAMWRLHLAGRYGSGGGFYLGFQGAVDLPLNCTMGHAAWSLETIYSTSKVADVAALLKDGSVPIGDNGGNGWTGIIEISCGDSAVFDAIESDIENFVHFLTGGSVAVCSGPSAIGGSEVKSVPAVKAVVKAVYNTDMFRRKSLATKN